MCAIFGSKIKALNSCTALQCANRFTLDATGYVNGWLSSPVARKYFCRVISNAIFPF